MPACHILPKTLWRIRLGCSTVAHLFTLMTPMVNIVCSSSHRNCRAACSKVVANTSILAPFSAACCLNMQSLANDPANCGACNNTCNTTAPFCQAGTCVPAEPPCADINDVQCFPSLNANGTCVVSSGYHHPGSLPATRLAHRSYASHKQHLSHHTGCKAAMFTIGSHNHSKILLSTPSLAIWSVTYGQ